MELQPVLVNPTPVVHAGQRLQQRIVDWSKASQYSHRSSEDLDKIDANEVFEHIKDISDPEHPFSLEQLRVVNAKHLLVSKVTFRIQVTFSPTVPHCSMATLIGLSIRVKLLRALPRCFKLDILVRPGYHSSHEAVTKQINDKERVAAALENTNLLQKVDSCLDGKTAL